MKDWNTEHAVGEDGRALPNAGLSDEECVRYGISIAPKEAPPKSAIVFSTVAAAPGLDCG